ncbi:EF-hand domain-containing protein [Celeribacter sp. PS-C1]|uniref:EF-hand domain-containing protein n=1 Tax=Celeribacter sp. PS-C1 TaxID=2820813 RepID=UPI001CA49375|nr:EF-hand domain-containing protein [Celeribacter sp. PS-C1]MBW6419289.1 hypothetical protein [Celeribacter sp. PS-C1]
MKRFAFSLGLLAALPLAVQAQVGSAQGFGPQFMTNWDLDENGQVTRAEVLERRADLFYMFDSDEDGHLNDEEYAMFDETRALDRQMHMEDYGMTPGQAARQAAAPKGPQQGGRGQGMGPERGKGMAAGIDAVQGSMTRLSNDLNGDGTVTRDEFVNNGKQWFARMDRNRDGVVTLADFGN